MLTAENRIKMLKTWHETGGVVVMGYELYRTLVGPVRLCYVWDDDGMWDV